MAGVDDTQFPLRTQRNNIPYWELYQGFAQSQTPTESRLTRVCRVHKDYQSRWALDIFGDAIPVVRAGSAAISRLSPDDYGHSRFYYAQGADFAFGMEPHHLNIRGGILLFQEYVYRVHYSSLPYDVLDDDSGQMTAARAAGQTVELLRHVERVATQAVEAITVPGGAYKFVGTAQPIPEPAPKALPTRELTYTWHQVPAERIPVAAITTCSGKVNNAAFDAEARKTRWPFRNFAAGTLLMTGVDYRSYPNVAGRPTMDVIYKFAERNNGDAAEGGGVKAGWNHIYRHNTGTWVKVTHNGDIAGRTIYETASFNGLFTPAAPA